MPNTANPSGIVAAKKLIEESGNNFHAKVANFFRDNEWEVMISPYYVDPSTDKAREIDLIAEKVFPVKHRYYEQWIGSCGYGFILNANTSSRIPCSGLM